MGTTVCNIAYVSVFKGLPNCETHNHQMRVHRDPLRWLRPDYRRTLRRNLRNPHRFSRLAQSVPTFHLILILQQRSHPRTLALDPSPPRF